jgi:hypothetical protein
VASSKWADELVPTAIIILDFDDEGRAQQKRLVGDQRNTPAVVSRDSVLMMNQFLTGTDQTKNATTEDLVPTRLFVRAVERYLQRWLAEQCEQAGDLTEVMSPDAFQRAGHVAAARAVFERVRGTSGEEYDKLGVFEELFRELHEASASPKKPPQEFLDDREELRGRIIALCHVLRAKIEASAKTERQRTGVQAIRRLINDFFLEYQSIPPATLDLELKLERLVSEAHTFGADEASRLLTVLTKLIGQVRSIRQGGRNELSNEDWRRWKADLEAISHNPLDPQLPIPQNVAPPAPPSAVQVTTSVTDVQLPSAVTPKPAGASAQGVQARK